MSLLSSFPPADKELSPSTGWTRDHWEALADRMLAAVRPYASAGHSLIDLPGPASVSGRWCDGLEGFARTFLLAGFRLAGGDRADAGEMTELAAWYARGLDVGTDPGHAERWPTLIEKAQAKVECASIALALHLSRAWIWDRLDDRVRQRVVHWMTDMLGTTTPDNNWVWFQNITEAFMRSVGGPWSAADIERNIAMTESWYVGDGWYSDGDEDQGGNRNFDYYSGWAMQFYPLWYCQISGDATEPGLLDTYRERLSRYLADVRHLVGADGAPLFQGRSLTYRFAMLAPFWAGTIFDATPLPPGQTRRLASGVLRYFVRSGSLDDDMVLRLGWHGEFPAIRQWYSGPASPYWASKGFAGLLLPGDHPVWKAVEEPLEIEDRDIRLTLTAPGWLVSGTTADGIVRVVNHGGDHARPGTFQADDPFYGRFAYSTHSAPDLGEIDATSPIDSHVALVAADGRASLRRPFERLGVHGRIGVSRHQTHWPIEPAHAALPRLSRIGPTLTTASVLRGAVEVRLVRVDPPPPDHPDNPRDPGPWRLRIGGAALAAGEAPSTELTDHSASVRRADGVVSAVVGLCGLTRAGVAERRDANAFGRFSACPWVSTGRPVEQGDVVAAAVLFGAGTTTAGALGITVERHTTEDDDVVVVSWPDGERDAVRLDRPAGQVR